MPRSTRGLTGEKGGAAAGGGGGVGPPKVYPEENSESATAERENKDKRHAKHYGTTVHTSQQHWTSVWSSG
jgi:hypothetical protein